MPVSLLPGRRVLVPEGEGAGEASAGSAQVGGDTQPFPAPGPGVGGPSGDFPAPPPCGPQVESGGAWEPLGPCRGGGGQAAGWCVGLRRQLHLSHAPENERPLPPPSGSSGRGGGGDGGARRGEGRGQRAEGRGRGRGQGEEEGPHLQTLLPCLSPEALPQSSSASAPRGTPQVNRDGCLTLSIANPGHARRSREGSFWGLPHQGPQSLQGSPEPSPVQGANCPAPTPDPMSPFPGLGSLDSEPLSSSKPPIQHAPEATALAALPVGAGCEWGDSAAPPLASVAAPPRGAGWVEGMLFLTGAPP